MPTEPPPRAVSVPNALAASSIRNLDTREDDSGEDQIADGAPGGSFRVQKNAGIPAPRDGRDSLDAPRSRKKSHKKIVDKPNVEDDDDNDDLILASSSSKNKIKDRWSKFSFSHSR